MFDRRALAAVIATGVAGLAACTGSASRPAGNGATGTSAVKASAAKGVFSAERLSSALLTRVNGVSPAGRVEAGGYASLPEVRQAVESMAGIAVTPKGCAQPAVAGGVGLDGSLGSAPAAVVRFRVGPNGVSEILAAPAGPAAAAALGTRVSDQCAHYAATSFGKTNRFAVRQSRVTGIGKQARMLSVSPVGNASDEVWSLVYRGDGFIGAITITGPDASEAAVRQLGQQAYAYAAKSLSS